jgi:chromate transporter
MRPPGVYGSGNAMSNVAPPRSLAELFLGFLSIGARSFGGVMPLAYRVMVEERRWISAADFTETVGLCQFLPGPNVGNMSVVLGRRWFGWRGSLVGFLGLVAVPLVWALALAAFYSDYASSPAARAVVIGVGAAGAGLFIGTAVKLGRPLAGKPGAWVVAIGCFLAVAVARAPLLAVIPVAAGVAVLLSRAHRL